MDGLAVPVWLRDEPRDYLAFCCGWRWLWLICVPDSLLFLKNLWPCWYFHVECYTTICVVVSLEHLLLLDIIFATQEKKLALRSAAAGQLIAASHPELSLVPVEPHSRVWFPSPHYHSVGLTRPGWVMGGSRPNYYAANRSKKAWNNPKNRSEQKERKLVILVMDITVLRYVVYFTAHEDITFFFW